MKPCYKDCIVGLCHQEVSHEKSTISRTQKNGDLWVMIRFCKSELNELYQGSGTSIMVWNHLIFTNFCSNKNCILGLCHQEVSYEPQ